MSTEMLEKRIAALERKLGGKPEPKPEPQPTLANEIEALEQRLAMGDWDEPGMRYMDDDLDVLDDVEEDLELDEPGMMYMDDLDDFDEPGCRMMSSEREGSEMAPGVEDEITQDYLDEVEELRPGSGTRETNPSMLDVAPTGYTARLQQASVRLDRVAAYLENQGRKDLAARIDMIANTTDARIKNGGRE